jgi:hypothetical protein
VAEADKLSRIFDATFKKRPPWPYNMGLIFKTTKLYLKGISGICHADV